MKKKFKRRFTEITCRKFAAQRASRQRSHDLKKRNQSNALDFQKGELGPLTILNNINTLKSNYIANYKMCWFVESERLQQDTLATSKEENILYSILQ